MILKKRNKSYISENFFFVWKLISEEYNRGWLRITVLLRHEMGSKHFLIICFFRVDLDHINSFFN